MKYIYFNYIFLFYKLIKLIFKNQIYGNNFIKLVKINLIIVFFIFLTDFEY